MCLITKVFVYAYNGSCVTVCQGGEAGAMPSVNVLQVPIDATTILPGK